MPGFALKEECQFPRSPYSSALRARLTELDYGIFT